MRNTECWITSRRSPAHSSGALMPGSDSRMATSTCSLRQPSLQSVSRLICRAEFRTVSAEWLASVALSCRNSCRASSVLRPASVINSATRPSSSSKSAKNKCSEFVEAWPRRCAHSDIAVKARSTAGVTGTGIEIPLVQSIWRKTAKTVRNPTNRPIRPAIYKLRQIIRLKLQQIG